MAGVRGSGGLAFASAGFVLALTAPPRTKAKSSSTKAIIKTCNMHNKDL